MSEQWATATILALALTAMVAIVAVFGLLATIILPGREALPDLWQGAIGGFAQSGAIMASGLFILAAALFAVSAARIQAAGTVEGARLQIAADQGKENADRLAKAKVLAAEALWEVSFMREALVPLGTVARGEDLSTPFDTLRRLKTIPRAAYRNWSVEDRALLGADFSFQLARVIGLEDMARRTVTSILASEAATESDFARLSSAVESFDNAGGTLQRAISTILQAKSAAEIDTIGTPDDPFARPSMERPLL